MGIKKIDMRSNREVGRQQISLTSPPIFIVRLLLRVVSTLPPHFQVIKAFALIV
ncbi:hypothetical protein QT972_01405 [Microcoleus sp. herbarium7]|uniref:hypothetical protein n=1 Tax=Microcoleus sp. herbarium7 TaxID=3055435 RepID=UPI002FD69550